MRLALVFCSMSLATGCSFFYGDELDRTQCQVDADCTADASRSLACVENVCQVATPISRACSQDSQCAMGERCGYDGTCYAQWGCVDAPADWPVPTVPFHVRTFLRRVDNAGADVQTVGDVDAFACVAEDPLCTTPLLTSGQISLATNKELDVPFASVSSSGFIGMLKIQPRQADAYLPTYLHATGASPWVADYVTAKDTFLTTRDTTALLQQFVGVPVNPQGALVGFVIYDCGGRPAAGVQVTPTNAREAVFIPVTAGNVPLVGGKSTTDEGTGFLLDVPANRLAVLELREMATQRVLAPTVSFIVQESSLNFFNYYPRFSAVQAWMKEYRRRMN